MGLDFQTKHKPHTPHYSIRSVLTVLHTTCPGICLYPLSTSTFGPLCTSVCVQPHGNVCKPQLLHKHQPCGRCSFHCLRGMRCCKSTGAIRLVKPLLTLPSAAAPHVRQELPSAAPHPKPQRTLPHRPATSCPATLPNIHSSTAPVGPHVFITDLVAPLEVKERSNVPFTAISSLFPVY